MTTRHPLLVLVFALTVLLSVGESAFAQRGGRSSGRQATNSGSRSSSSSGARSSSRSSSRTSSPGRSRTPSYSPPSRSTPSRSSSPSRSTPSRTTAPSRSSSSSSSRTRYAPPSTSSPRDTTRPTTQPSSSRMPAYTPPTRPQPTPSPSSYDLSRRSSTSSSIDDATVRVSNRALGTSRVSTVPKPYGSSSARSRIGSASSAINSRREALSRGLRDSSSFAEQRRESADSLAKSYSPSRNADSNRRGRTARPIDPNRAVAYPGTDRRAAVDRLNATRENDSSTTATADQLATRIAAARAQSEAKESRIRRLRSSYEEATRDDPALRKRMENISRAINRATDAGIQAGIGSARRATGSTTPGAGETGDDGSTANHDNGYYDDPYYNCNSWYWNCFFPNYCNWWFGYWGWGWGSGFGYCYKSYYWPYYSAYGYYGYYPAYGYCSPAIVYNYTLAPDPIQEETVVYVETPAAETSGPILAQATAGTPRYRDLTFGDRAATEYMSLGDRAFTEGRYGDAVHYYAKSIQFAPEDGVLYLVLSDALFATGDYHYAAFALRRALEFNPELAALGIDKRTFYGRPAEFDEQLALLAKFVADHPIDRDARLVLAANYLFSMNAEDAVNTLDGAPGGVNPNSKASKLLLAAGTGMLAE